MATTKSGKKAVRQAQKRRVFNLRRLRAMREAIKNVEVAATTDAKAAMELLSVAYKAIDKAAKRGVLKANTAARRKSYLAKKVATK